MKKWAKSNSILKRLLFPMILVMLVQMLLPFGTVLFGGTIEQLNQNAFDLLGERMINRKTYLENDMVQRWSDVAVTAGTLESEASAFLKERGLSAGELDRNSADSDELLYKASGQLLYMLRKNGVTGVFYVLDGDGFKPTSGDPAYKSGLFIRNADPATTTADHSDLLIERAPVSVARKLGISMDVAWQRWFTYFEDGADDGYDSFYKPLEAARATKREGYKDFGYWNRANRLVGDSTDEIAYSIPLCLEDGTPYAVLGVTVSLDYLHKQLPYDELLEDKKGSYLLGVTQGAAEGEKMQLAAVASTGPGYNRLFGQAAQVTFGGSPVYGNSYRAEHTAGQNEHIYGCMEPLHLYDSNSPFESEQWMLVGLVPEDVLLSFSNRIQTDVIVATAVAFIVGLAAVCIAGGWLARPITGLVKNSNPSQPVDLGRTHISELDELAVSIEGLSRDVAESASKLSKIIQVAGVPVGAFEYRKDGQGKMFYTQSFLHMMGLAPADRAEGFGYMDISKFRQMTDSLSRYMENEEEIGGIHVFRIPQPDGTDRWIRMKSVQEEDSYLGVAVDITADVQAKQRVEHERDFDLLTNLMNRRAFHARLASLFSHPEQLGVGALIMMDLDNLKYINDTFGHDYGDEYLRCAAGVLKKFIPFGAAVSRMSGDEFYMFIYGYEDKEGVRQVLLELQRLIKNTYLPLMGDETVKLRASVGYTWYPDDSRSYEELIRFADFAMYTAKHTAKGEFREFDRKTYQKDAYLLHNREELNTLIDEQMVEYYFQPIVDARTGDIFGYEALMRSTMQTLGSPAEILAIARSQSKLADIERLTWFHALQDFSEYTHLPADRRIFINSIPNQRLTEEEIRTLEHRFPNCLSRVVIELTEEEKLNEEYTTWKQYIVRRWGAAMALDDFGTGYNGEVVLLELTPNFVKIDIELVRGIDRDPNRQKILQNLLSYAGKRHIRSIAEGVETADELRYLIGAGVDYLQGYFLGRPSRVPVLSLHEELVRLIRDAQPEAPKG